jgi:hypothetical protein
MDGQPPLIARRPRLERRFVLSRVAQALIASAYDLVVPAVPRSPGRSPAAPAQGPMASIKCDTHVSVTGGCHS